VTYDDLASSAIGLYQFNVVVQDLCSDLGPNRRLEKSDSVRPYTQFRQDNSDAGLLFRQSVTSINMPTSLSVSTSPMRDDQLVGAFEQLAEQIPGTRNVIFQWRLLEGNDFNSRAASKLQIALPSVME
jgi:hypothetical protein